jgi:dihydrofolate reductase
VIGGAQLYALALPLATTLLLTEIDADLSGDAHFPAWDRTAFDEAERRSALTAAGVAYHFVTYRRR